MKSRRFEDTMDFQSKKCKRTRKKIAVKDKVIILERLKSGGTVADTAKEFHLNESTVRTIKRGEDKIMKLLQQGNQGLISTYKIRDPIMHQMEEELVSWIEHKTQNNAELTGNDIKRQALKIYDDLKNLEENPNVHHFNASQGWYSRFKDRYSIETNRVVRPNFVEVANELILSSDEEGFTEVIGKQSFNGEIEIISCDEDSSVEEVPLKEDFPLEQLRQGIDLANHVEAFFLNMDPSTERSNTFRTQLRQCLAPYLKLQADLEKMEYRS